MGRRTLLLVSSVLLAAIGVALVALYVRGADARAAARTRTVPVLVAAKDLDAGQAADNGSFKFVQMPHGIVPPNEVNAAPTADQLATGPIAAGQFILKGMFSKSGASVSPRDATPNTGWTELSIGGAGVPSGTQIGSMVGIVAVDQQKGTARPLVPSAKVVRLQGQSRLPGATAGTEVSRVTVETTTRQALTLVAAAGSPQTELAVVLLNSGATLP